MPRRVVKAGDLGPLRPIGNNDLTAICSVSKITTEQRGMVADFLAEVIAEFNGQIQRDRALPTRKPSDRR